MADLRKVHAMENAADPSAGLLCGKVTGLERFLATPMPEPVE